MIKNPLRELLSDTPRNRSRGRVRARARVVRARRLPPRATVTKNRVIKSFGEYHLSHAYSSWILLNYSPNSRRYSVMEELNT